MKPSSEPQTIEETLKEVDVSEKIKVKPSSNDINLDYLMEQHINPQVNVYKSIPIRNADLHINIKKQKKK